MNQRKAKSIKGAVANFAKKAKLKPYQVRRLYQMAKKDYLATPRNQRNKLKF